MDNELLKTILDKQEEHSAILAKLCEDTSILKEGFSNLERNHTTLEGNQATLKENQAILKENQATLEENQAALKGNQATLKENQATLKENQTTLKENQATLKENQISLKATLDEHSEELASIHRSLVVIEDAVTNKIPALFDAFLANQEKHEEYDKELEHLETVTQKNSIRISVLESTSKMHSKKLAKLSS